MNGQVVSDVASDLTAWDGSSNNDLTQARKLPENSDTSFIGTQKNEPFDIPHAEAASWLLLPNPNEKSNALVVRPWANGLDITRRPQDRWVIDFGCDMSLEDACLFETPFAYVQKHVQPTRTTVRRDFHRTHWWLYGDARPGLRKALSSIERFIVTPMVAKHRVFAWLPAVQIPENLCVAITRADDTTFGILHSRFRELWSLRMCTWLGVGNDPRYTPTTCFETFPFPAGLTPADTAHQQTETLLIGASIPQLPGFYEKNKPLAHTDQTQTAINNEATSAPSSSTVKSPAPSAPAPAQATDTAALRQHAERIASAAKRLNDRAKPG